jgi:predicted metal-dependent phosphoesterase TrpH
MNDLKVDLHTHTREDPKDIVHYDACALIDKAQQLGYDALAITNHDVVTDWPHILEHAAQKGVLLIPGMEATLSNKHVVILNPAIKTNAPQRRLEDLPELVTEKSLVLAPHPFFPQIKSLHKKLAAFLPLFHAVEYSHFYTRSLNFNKQAVRLAHTHRLPLVGTSDCHILWEFGTTFSMVKADRNIDSIIQAVKQGRIQVVTSALKSWQMAYLLGKIAEIKLFHLFSHWKPGSSKDQK